MDNMVERSKVIEDYDALCGKLYSALCINDCVDERELENRISFLRNTVFPIIDEFKGRYTATCGNCFYFMKDPCDECKGACSLTESNGKYDEKLVGETCGSFNYII
jgi:hypothetical protein